MSSFAPSKRRYASPTASTATARPAPGRSEHGKMAGVGSVLNLGTYDDVCVRENGVWRFASRRFRPLYIGPPDLSGEPAGGA